ncbi:S9 family peptidase [Massilia sp. KIM]|uniref:prolyl oligopeptidase family serine peptidase n=1 Tax=Massilia sp. KIM TaxID=1955422 RepID=UPI00098EBEE6|nr:prolyl oligopeptidase family serine peptidase [Massilia sp. KIM]OON62463.1 S9 family peptidase [Massilia sp. KIM]
MNHLVYPKTPRDDLVETLFGKQVSDPYRWLENDPAENSDVAAWVCEQQALTEHHLSSLPGREVFRQRLIALENYEKFTAPQVRGEWYFHLRTSGLEDQRVLYIRHGLDGLDRTLIDPNSLASDINMALAEWSPSFDGQFVAYAFQENGSDWRTINVINSMTGTHLSDKLKWVRFTTISWAADCSGFFYSRFPASNLIANSTSALSSHAVYFHALGTDQDQDRLVHSTPDQAELLHFAEVSNSGRFLVISSTPGTQTNSCAIVDLDEKKWRVKEVVNHLDSEWTLVGDFDGALIMLTSDQAERRRVVAVALLSESPAIRTLVEEKEAALVKASLVADRLILTYLIDAKCELRRYKLDGTPDGEIHLPGLGTAIFESYPDSIEAFFTFMSFNSPDTIYRYDVLANTYQVWAAPTLNADLAGLVVEQRFYVSQDGTQVPMFLIRNARVHGSAPTLLQAYGGFGISMVPFFDPALLAWVEQGGIAAIANVRGGGEYGKAWHNAGRLLNKQTTFDDLAAAAVYLRSEGIVSADGLALHGESNGGLSVAAVVNQHPELFAAALPAVGVMDMLRYTQFTGGYLWVGEFGDPQNADYFPTLLKYSPYHNVTSGKLYPAVLATTADTDDRVVPAHSFKYIAALQAAEPQGRPHLVRVESKAGHGSGKPTKQAVAEKADKWAFAAYWTGLEVD